MRLISEKQGFKAAWYEEMRSTVILCACFMRLGIFCVWSLGEKQKEGLGGSPSFRVCRWAAVRFISS